MARDIPPLVYELRLIIPNSVDVCLGLFNKEKDLFRVLRVVRENNTSRHFQFQTTLIDNPLLISNTPDLKIKIF